VRRSVLSPRAHLHSRAEVNESVLFSGVEVGGGAVIRRAIIDKDVYIAPGATIGVDSESDRRRFTVSEGGVVVVPKGTIVTAGDG
ncbi:MAG: glucose-1-phosphate adenylyltransferase, partial [Solirubrobacteraceae bacterium]